MMKPMMKLTGLGCLLLGLTLAGEAQATEPIRIRIRVEPTSNTADLARLMRVNSLRIALQRHRRWQAAVRHEEKRSRTQKRVRNSKRHKKAGPGRKNTPAMTPSAMALPPRARVLKRTAMCVTQKARQAAMVPDLRGLLRRGRVGSRGDLERKLRARIEEQRRQQERLRSRGRQGSSMATRRGGRSGR
jgi:hypothetical protein